MKAYVSILGAALALTMCLGGAKPSQASAQRLAAQYTATASLPHAYIGNCYQNGIKSICIVKIKPDGTCSGTQGLGLMWSVQTPTGYLEEHLLLTGTSGNNSFSFMTQSLSICGRSLHSFKMKGNGLLQVRMLGGDDDIGLGNGTDQPFRVIADMGEGNNSLSLWNGTNTAGYTNSSIAFGSGNDHLRLQVGWPATAAFTSIDMGSGADLAETEGDAQFRFNSVTLGSGTDEMKFWGGGGNNVEFFQALNCGTGTDTLLNFAMATGGSSSTTGCETINGF